MDIYGDLPPSPVLAASDAAASSSEAGPSAAAQGSSPKLEQELDALVGNLGATLGSFWSGVRKQSQTAFAASRRELEALNEAAKKDFAPLMNKAREDLAPLVSKAREDIAPYMTKAREELNRLGEQAKNSAAAGQAAAIGSPPALRAELPATTSDEAGQSNEEKTVAPGESGEITFGIDGEIITSPNSGTAPPPPDQAPPQLEAFFTKMHNLQTQIQANPTVAEFSRKVPNLSQIQSSISQLQAKLPDQVSRSEAYLQRAGKELTELLGNAVKVVPPTDAELAALHATGKPHVLSRKEALLHRLRSEPAVMLVDPAQPPPSSPKSATTPSGRKSDDFKASLDTREEYAKFLQSIEDNGGLESEAWQKRISDELALPNGEGSALSKAFAMLVPEKIPSEAFWARYFFRSHQIDQDEARRRQVLEGASQQAEDDFSWDAEEEDADTPLKSGTPAPPPEDTLNPPLSASSKFGSERTSSEDGQALSTSSYDIVSRKQSEDERAKGAGKAEDEEDSDWE